MPLRLAAATCVVFGGLASAPLSAHDEYGFVGTLVKVNLAKNRVTVKYEENKKLETVDIDLTPKTEITRDKQQVPKTALKVGLSVVVRALGDDTAEHFEALQIRIVPPLPTRGKGQVADQYLNAYCSFTSS